MDVKDIIDVNTIKINMNAKSKEEALIELANLLLENEYITDIEGFMKDIYDREAEGQTGIGNYIAIPHGKSDFVQKLGVAIGISEEEIPWETLDGNGVKGIILFAVGNDNEGAQNHLKLLSLFARKLGNDEVIKKLLHASKREEAKEAFSN
ncbi:PTS fructose transporter subunit IIA [Oceanobacillus oncorhynchi subsp. incaldanensis]|uniref:Fructose PTS transporter subunit IIA n=1 Tax=Oceanobacillus aidingensis TaxID=645964 RepID=A0ABV9JTS3_9BACI|nr:fructose PTS transporter subunit IIA [Oceanobacillus oncorhynchi]MDM8101013.1 fructose PTS transporter subunit IIA [Oceanobacillus oncorhynchi]UUI40652.1 fructose PTS transporter subunit IIA [Oceanobacillus oncorhynchi]GIO19003.1 PTS fructose transporter subunit IIA [Oceanobacillus oncorhynchi subsp. incaldanensis]